MKKNVLFINVVVLQLHRRHRDTETVELNKNLQHRKMGQQPEKTEVPYTLWRKVIIPHTPTGNLKVASSNLQLSGRGTQLERVWKLNSWVFGFEFFFKSVLLVMVHSEAWNQQVLTDCFWAPNNQWWIIANVPSYSVMQREIKLKKRKKDDWSYNKQSPRSRLCDMLLIIGDVSAAVGANTTSGTEL